MPHPPLSRDRRAGSQSAAVMVLAISAVLLWAMPLSRAAGPDAASPPQPSAASEAPSSAIGPLSPVRREPPAAAQSSSKPASAATKPTITMPAPAQTPSADNATPSAPPAAAKPQPQKTEHGTSGMPAAAAKAPPKEAEHAIPVTPAPAAKTAKSEPKKPEPKQADEATPPRPHRKPPSTRSESAVVNLPGERRPTMIERRDRVVEFDRIPPRERVYREEYSWSDEAPVVRRRGAPYPPPPGYADEPDEIGPRPFAPPWSYRYRSFAWGPYPGMPGPRFGPPY